MTYKQIAEKIEKLTAQRDVLINKRSKETDLQAIKIQDKIIGLNVCHFNKRLNRYAEKHIDVTYQEVLPL